MLNSAACVLLPRPYTVPPMMVSVPIPATIPGSRRNASARLVSGPIIRMSAFSLFLAASLKVRISTPTASSDAGLSCFAGRRAPPRPSSPCTSLASMTGCVSGRSAPRCTGIDAPRCAQTASRLVAAWSRPTLPKTAVMMSGARPLAASRMRACASSTPPSLSRISVRFGTSGHLSFDRRLLVVGHAPPEGGVRRGIVAADVIERPPHQLAITHQLLTGDPDVPHVAAAAGIDQQRFGIGRFGIAGTAQVDGDDVGGLA